MSTDNEEFQLVRSRKCRKKCQLNKKQNRWSIKNQHDVSENTSLNLTNLLKTVQECRLELEQSIFKRDFTDTVLKAGIMMLDTEDGRDNKQWQIEKVVSYGIGNYSSCPIARYQFAFLQVLCELLRVEARNCSVYDPIFTTVEKDGVLKLDYQLIQQNEEGKRQTDGKTLFYMPHCSKSLYNNLIWANWDPIHLENVVIIGNSFTIISESIPDREFKKDLHCMFKAMKVMVEFPLPNTFVHKDIFNNMSLHIFCSNDVSAKMAREDEEFWSRTEEPKYTDSEIITAQ